MSKGGYFPNAERWGRKSGWNDPVTKVIRVPESIADQIIDIAHKLDRGIILDSVTEAKSQEIDSVTKAKSEQIDSVTEAKEKQIAELAQNLEQVKITLQEALKLKANAGGAIKAEIRKALELLGDRLASSADQMPVDDGER